MAKKLIITADDYGVFPAINKAIIEAVKDGPVNSVAVFPNYDGASSNGTAQKTMAENVKELLDATNGDVEIGCHLTITSGKPVTGGMKFLSDKNGGNFPEYFNIPYFKKDAELKALKDELIAQVEKINSIEKNLVKHLTNHHNSLTVFPEHFDIYMDVARHFSLPMRSADVRPEGKQNLYLTVLRTRLHDNISEADREEAKKLGKKITTYFSEHANGVKSTSYLESCHYGPPPPLPKFFRPDKQKKKKLVSLFQAFGRLNTSVTDNSMELMLHLGKDNIPGSETIDYSGVNHAYFPARIAEFQSIMELDTVNQLHPLDIDIVSWSAL